MLYLWWYDDNPKIPLAQRLAEGAAAYERRFGVAPNVRQMSADEAGEGADKVTTLTKNNYRFAYEAPKRPDDTWQTQKPYADEIGKSCPALIEHHGRTLAYVDGSLMAPGGARFVEVTR